MKKQYANPTVKVVFIEDADIVTESNVNYNNETVDGVKAQSNRRGGIWGEDD